jgi:hypothetical protein
LCWWNKKSITLSTRPIVVPASGKWLCHRWIRASTKIACNSDWLAKGAQLSKTWRSRVFNSAGMPDGVLG